MASTEGSAKPLFKSFARTSAGEEMLWQLKYNGTLDAAAGLVFGAFTGCRNAYREDYGPLEMIKDFFAGWPKPVLWNVRASGWRLARGKSQSRTAAG